MWDWSDKDCSIKYNLDWKFFDDDEINITEEYMPKRLGKKAFPTNMSKSDYKFAQDLYGQVEEITGLTFEHVDNVDASQIIVVNVMKSKQPQYTQMNFPYPKKFTTYWADTGSEGLNEIEKISLAQALVKPLGLNSVNKKGIDTLDTVMSTKGDTYHGLSVDDVMALQDIGSFHCELV